MNSRPVVFGKASSGTELTITAANRTYTETADSRGNWQFIFPQPLPVGMTWVQVEANAVSTSAEAQGEQETSSVIVVATEATPYIPPSINWYPVGTLLQTEAILLSGAGAPGTTIQIVNNAGDQRAVLGRTVVDADGRWRWNPAEPLPAGDYAVQAVTVDGTGSPLTQSDFRYFRIGEEVGLETEPQIDSLTTPDDPDEAESPADVLIEILEGTASPEARLFLYIDGKWLDEIRVDRDGRWRYVFPKPLVSEGQDVHVVEVDDAGRPIAMSAPSAMPRR